MNAKGAREIGVDVPFLFLISCLGVNPHAQPMDEIGAEKIRLAVAAALAEDVGEGDITTLATVPGDLRGGVAMVAREPMTIAGLDVVESVFRQLSNCVRLERIRQDGESVGAGDRLMRVEGLVRPILTGERVALNFLQRLCGVATLTREYVNAVVGTGAVILDTRKTTPGLRWFEKYAVRCGGGSNHRMGLYDAVLIKDNHLAALRGEAPNPIAAAVARVRRQFPGRSIEVEADTLAQVADAVEAGADTVLLDNMTIEDLRSAVGLARGRAKTEASGGVNLRTVRAIAETGVDFISVGALTHSARAMDIALDWEAN